MTILFNNELKNATSVTAVNTSPNYPTSNLSSVALQKRWQSLANDDTITIQFADPVAMNCFFLGFHNLVGDVVVNFFGQPDGDIMITEDNEIMVTEDDQEMEIDMVVTALRTVNEDTADQVLSAYFDELPVFYITIQVSAGAALPYVGGIGVGKAFEMPLPKLDYSTGFEDNSKVERTSGGQVYKNYIRPLRVVDMDFNPPELEQKRELEDFLIETGIGAPVWVDFFEESSDTFKPMYAEITTNADFKRDWLNYDFSLKFREAR